MSTSPTSYQLDIAADSAQLARRCAERIAACIDLALDERDRAHIALSGGSTPAAAYRLLNQEHLPWSRVDVVLGDERWVAATDPESNARMLRETLLAAGGPGSAACFHPVPTDLDSPQAGVDAFERHVQQLCPGDPPCFDLVLLGLGDDGHTASLFPGTAATQEQRRLVTIGSGKGLDRISLTAPVLSAARQVIVLVSGAAKRQALQRLLDPMESAERTPAKLVRPRSPVWVLADAAATEGLG